MYTIDVLIYIMFTIYNMALYFCFHTDMSIDEMYQKKIETLQLASQSKSSLNVIWRRPVVKDI